MGPGRARALSRAERRDDGTRNGITMRRLKEKLGTKSVPTGEVEFHDALGYALRPGVHRRGRRQSDAGGSRRMMEMVNGSRLGVAIMGLGIARRSFLEAMIWAHHRRGEGPPARRPPARARAARRPALRARGRVRARLRVLTSGTFATATACAGSSSPRRRSGSADSVSSAASAPSSSTAATATARTGASPASCATRSAIRSGKAARTSAASTCCGRSGAMPPTRPRSSASTTRSPPRPAPRRSRARRSPPSPARATTFARRVDAVLAMERDESEARSAALASALVHTDLGRAPARAGPGDARKALVAVRYAVAGT